MKNCTVCGALNSDNETACINCKNALVSAAPVGVNQAAVYTPPTAPQTPPMSQPQYAPPAAPATVNNAAPPYPPSYQPPQAAQSSGAPQQANSDLPPPAGSRFAVLSTGSIWGSIFLMNIPIIGWIVCLVWAFSKKVNLNRRNLARAMIIFIIIQVISFWLFISAVNAIAGMVTQMFNTMLNDVVQNTVGEIENGNFLLNLLKQLNIF